MTIVLIEPTSEGVNLIATARRLGRHTTVLTAGSGDRVIPAEALAQAGRVVKVDTNDDLAVERVLDALEREDDIEAVLPGFEYYVPLAARAGSRRGLRGMGPADADAVRYKDLMRVAVSGAGLASPRFRVLDRFDEPTLRDAATAVGFPAVAKVVDLSGGQGIRKVCGFNNLLDYADWFKGNGLSDLSRYPAPRFLLEEFLPGSVGSVEGYVDEEGDVHVVSVTEKRISAEPFFVEVGHIVQAALPEPQRRAVVEYATAVVDTLRIFGVFHLEYRQTPDRGPVLLEVGARLAGDHIVELIKRATGTDLREAMLRCYLGLPVGRPCGAQDRSAGIRFFMRPDLRRFREIEGRDAVERLTGFVEMAVTATPETELPDAVSFAGRLGYVIVEGPSRDEVARRLDEADRLVRFVE